MAQTFIENRIIIGLIVSDGFIQQVREFVRLDYFVSTEARSIADWCFSFYDTYEKAPGSAIHDVFQSKRRGDLSDDAADWYDLIFESLSAEAERGASAFNVEYLVAETEKYCRERAFRLFTEDVLDGLDAGDLQSAEGALARFVLPERLQSQGLFPFSVDADHVRDVFSQQETQLVSFPGALDEFIGPLFTRDSFVAFMGPEKSGKSFWLMEVAFRALQSRRSVAFYQAGDMSERQMELRLYSRLTGAPVRKLREFVLRPVLDCAWNQDDSCTLDHRVSGADPDLANVIASLPKNQFGYIAGCDSIADVIEIVEEHKEHTPCVACVRGSHAVNRFRGAVWYSILPAGMEAFTWRDAYRKVLKFGKLHGKRFYLETHSNDSLTISGIKNSLDVQEKNTGFAPDVIVIDYADLLTTERRFSDERSAQNAIWKRLRALSQERHCCVITATQADASSYDARLLRRKNFSEDKRKYAHVTGMLGINQIDGERSRGLSRLNKLVVRDGAYSESRVVKVLECLELGRPALSSFF